MQYVFLVCEGHLPDFHPSANQKNSSKNLTLFPAVLSPLFGVEVSVLDCASCALYNRELQDIGISSHSLLGSLKEAEISKLQSF